MKLITTRQSYEGLKILFSAELAKVSVSVDFEPNAKRSVLYVKDDVRLFSTNAAVWYISSLNGRPNVDAQQDSWLEWESSVLAQQIQLFVAKSPNTVPELLTHIENQLKSKYLIGVSLFSHPQTRASPQNI